MLWDIISTISTHHRVDANLFEHGVSFALLAELASRVNSSFFHIRVSFVALWMLELIVLNAPAIVTILHCLCSSSHKPHILLQFGYPNDITSPEVRNGHRFWIILI